MEQNAAIESYKIVLGFMSPNVQANLNHRWAHMSDCTLSDVATHIFDIRESLIEHNDIQWKPYNVHIQILHSH